MAGKAPAQKGTVQWIRTPSPPVTRRTPYADLPERMTVHEFVCASGAGRATVYDAVKRGELPVVRVCRRVFISREALSPTTER